MRFQRCSTGFAAFWCGGILLLGLVPQLRADEPAELDRQTREYRISVDDKPRGTCRMEIQRRDDGTDLLRIHSSLQFNYIVYKYRYSSQGSELWNGDRLVNLQNRADFNGDIYQTKATAAADAIAITVNDESSTTNAPAWPTSYWRLPRFAASSNRVKLLDSDRGRLLDAKLERLGQETVTITAQPIRCTHYRLSGEVEVELWYDARNLLVRQEAVESGHKTQLELTQYTP